MLTLLCVSIATAVFLRAGSASAYRTGADLPELETDAAVRWQSPRIDFVVGGAAPRGREVSDVARVLREAMGAWSVAACGTVALSYTGASTADAIHGDGVNSVSFVFSNWESLASNDAAATTDVIYERREGEDWSIVEADIYLNAETYSWAPGATGGEQKDLFFVLLHELGHALGLLHPCEIGGATGVEDCNSTAGFAATVMFPGYRPENHELTSDDRAGLCFLYGCTETCTAPCSGDSCARPRPG